MIRPRFDWLLPAPLDRLPTLTGFGAPVATLLVRRGIQTDAEAARFLNAGATDLPSLDQMTDAEAAIDRIERAVVEGESIAIWGDYDADGMTAVAIFVLALRHLGVEPIRYVPSRLAEGYGLSVEGLRSLAGRGVRLVVTCDCGVGNAAEVAVARELGMDVVVTDHHVPQGILPAAVAVVDPHRADCAYPNRDLTGAGLAYRLATALLARRGLEAPDLAALAAIGAIADVAPMTGESRAIVRMGLAELAATTHPGLRGLVARGADDPARPTARDVGFGIVPRLNAAGRIADAELALDLLVATDPAHAESLLAELEAVHERRRELTTVAIEGARGLAADLTGSGPLALRDDAWPAGLLGLVAGRLSDELARPVAAATLVESEVRGSIRAPADFDVAVALEAVGEHLAKRGGHAAAGGFSMAADRWDGFATAFGALPRPLPAGLMEAPLAADALPVDLVLPARYLGWSLLSEIGSLAPYGAGNAEPVLAVTGLIVGDARRVGVGAGHLSMRMRKGLETIDAIAFGVAADRETPEPGLALDLVGTLESRTLDGEPRLQLRVIDYATADASPLASRRREVRVPLEPVAVPG
ncbi:MAG TPA: single-stranded-DNA-specific exonuclease RecJ [Candidatus Limnocylindria bacterium]|nr:single-stranded-DNA-specific exonuclease RecJ [Candidatus Limnocylindria bacterium]